MRRMFWRVFHGVSVGLTGLVCVVANAWAIRFRFRHPEMTETELLLECWIAYLVGVVSAVTLFALWTERPLKDVARRKKEEE